MFLSPTGKDPGSRVVSLGMVVLDELRFPDRDTLYDVLGGSGTFATLGARLATGADDSKSVACIILTGDDFPRAVVKEFEKWNLTLVTRNVPDAKSTRGLLEYLDTEFGRKTFRYLTPPLQPTAQDLEASDLLDSSALHILATTTALQAHVTELRVRRARHEIASEAMIVWEPFPPHCVSANLGAHIEACRNIDVFSPNHLELIALFEEQPKGPFHRAAIEDYSERFRNAQLESSGKAVHIVIRAGEHGCFLIDKTGDRRWLPPYYDPQSLKIVDPTGAGNAFLGALTAVLQRGLCLSDAACFGNVAASFALEQIGLPKLEVLSLGAETWNGDQYTRRIEEYKDRIE